MLKRIFTCTFCAFLLFFMVIKTSLAMPVFARQYNVPCGTCHSAFPRLNDFGEQFIKNNFRLDNWREQTTINMGNDRLALPKLPPFAIRMQSYVQGRQGEEIDPLTGFTDNDSDVDFQTPYLIKLLSSAPLSDHITYYFYGIFAEKGGNGETVIEDAWFRYDDAFGSGISTQLGQFQVSDLMFPREIRLTFQDYMIYRMAGITYDRGILFDRDVGPFGLGLGIVNGNGISANYDVNSPGFRRPDNLFDNDTNKSVFARMSTDIGPVSLGLFGLSGKQKSAAGAAGETIGSRDTDKHIIGIDASGHLGTKTNWFAQFLWNEWDGFLDNDPNRVYRWTGMFAGVDYIANDRWTYSLLLNYADAQDLDNTGTIFEGLNIRTLTLTASYYFMQNLKAVFEVNGDFLSKDRDGDFIGHESKEGYIIIGLDAAF